MKCFFAVMNHNAGGCSIVVLECDHIEYLKACGSRIIASVNDIQRLGINVLYIIGHQYSINDQCDLFDVVDETIPMMLEHVNGDHSWACEYES